MAARAKKTVGTKKAASKKKAAAPKKRASAKKTSAKRKAAKRGVAGFGDFPQSLDQFSRQIRKNLTSLEKQMNKAGKEYRRSTISLFREVSHQLGHFEALGERRWKKLTNNARKDVAKLLRRLEKVIEPAKGRKKKASRKRAR